MLVEIRLSEDVGQAAAGLQDDGIPGRGARLGVGVACSGTELAAVAGNEMNPSLVAKSAIELDHGIKHNLA